MGSRQERASLLSESALFSQLTPVECQQLAPVFKARVLADGELLFRQGEPGDFMALVNKGELVVEVDDGVGEPTEVVRRGRAEVVGEMSCLDPAPRSATIRSVGSTQVLILSRSMLDSLKANAPGLFSRVVTKIAHRLAENLDRTNRIISGLLKVKRAPTQPRQPGLKKIQGARSTGQPLGRDFELPPIGVVSRLDDEERAILRTVSKARRYEAGEVICLEGAAASEAFILVGGGVDVLKSIGTKNYRLAQTPPGAFLGQRALLSRGRRSATLRAGFEGATILAIARDQFEALLEAESTLAIKFQEVVTIAGINALRQANEMAAYLGAREHKRQIPRPKSNVIKTRPMPSEPVADRVDRMVDIDLEEEDDIAALASAYLETALNEWDVSPSALERIQVVEADGEMSALEKKVRKKRDGQ